MNRQYVLLLLGFALLFSKSSYSQLSVSEITSSSAKVSFPNPNNDTKTIILESRTPEDTIIFKEDFSKLPRRIPAHAFAGYFVPSALPNSYTEYPGCQAQNIASIDLYTNTTDPQMCILSRSYSNSEPPSCFITPYINLSEVGEFRIRFSNHLPSSVTTNTTKLYISIMDINGQYTNIDSLVVADANTQVIYYDETFPLQDLPNNIDFSNTKIKFEIGFQNNRTATKISDLFITYEDIIVNIIPYTTNDNSLTINNLAPNKSYRLYFADNPDDATNFQTKEMLQVNEVNIHPKSVIIEFSSSHPDSKLVIKQLSKNNSYADSTILAKDLFISKYICTGMKNRGVEIYNGTGEDICLVDYTINTFFSSSNTQTLSFTDEDTIHSNSCILFCYNTIEAMNITNIKAFVYKNSHPTGTPSYINGDDAIALYKNNNIIDIFGHSARTSNWTWKINNITYNTSQVVLKRKEGINQGRITPLRDDLTDGNPNSMNWFLTNEWDIIYSGNAPNASHLSTVGTHVMTGAMNIPIDTNEVEELIDKSTSLGNEKYTYLLEGLEEDTFYEICLVADTGSSGNTGTIESNRMRFRTGKVTERNSNTGNWNDGDWTKGVPTERDYAVIGSTDKLTIPENEIARAKRVILKTDDSHNRAELRNYGEMEIDEFVIEVGLVGYTLDTNGWYLLGMPVNIDTENNPEQTINNLEDSLGIGGNDDLYYWQAEYSDDNNNEGRWVNYKSIPPETGDFFTNERGYLISYENDKTINFSGQIKNEDSYNLLDNITFESNASNWYLFHNPYPFTISYSNIDKTKVSNPNLLDYNSLNYTPLNPWDVNTYKIPPYTGFFVQVNVSGDNELVITKEENNNSAKSNDVLINYFNMDISSSSGYDKTKVVIIEGGSDEYNYVYDNRKLNGLGMSPEISSLINNESYAIKTIADFEDSLWIDLNVVIKQPGINDIGLEIMDTANLEEIVLIDKTDYSLLFDFLQDSIYSQSYSVGEYDNLRLLIKKRKTNTLEDIANNSDIIIVQEGNRAVVTSSNKINSLELINMKGQIINMNKNKNSIIIPEKGVFILKVITSEKEYNKKLINL